MSFMCRNFQKEENAGLVEELHKNENKIGQVEVMDISSQAVDEVEMQEPEVEDFDADGAGNPIQLVVEYVNDIWEYLWYVWLSSLL